MYLKSLSLVNFKTFREATLHFTGGINCFVGNNGVGKTNLLDAIHYLSMCKSHFNNIDSQNISYNEDFFVLQGQYRHSENDEEIYCGFKRNTGKILKRNKKEYDKLADHIGFIPLVMITPSDSMLITEGSEERRRFVDSVISQFNRAYLSQLIMYNRVLQQRNKLLKDIAASQNYDAEVLQIYSEQLAELGGQIFEKRKAFFEEFIPVFKQYYANIAGTDESVGIRYQSQLFEMPLSELLSKNLLRDRALEYTSQGIHKDDLEFLLNEYPAKRSASQGQQKTIVVALKLAEFEFIGKHNGKKPLLLLDDIFDKFDALRVKSIVQLAAGDGFGQIFITDTEIGRIMNVLNEAHFENRIFKIENGVVSVER